MKASVFSALILLNMSLLQTAGNSDVSVEDEVRTAMQEVVKGQSLTYDFIDRHGVSLLSVLIPYLTDLNKNIRIQSALAIRHIALNSMDPLVRQRVVDALLPHVQEEGHLGDFKPMDFSDASKAYIAKRIHELWEIGTDNEEFEQCLLASGAADMNNELPFLESIINDTDKRLEAEGDTRTFDRIQWAALRASARMGTKPHIARVIAMWDAIERDFDKRQRMQELVYVRQPEIVEYFAGYLMRKDAPEPLGTDVIQESYALWGAKALSEMLTDFPKYTLHETKDEQGYRAVYVVESDKLHRWTSEQKEWHFK